MSIGRGLGSKDLRKSIARRLRRLDESGIDVRLNHSQTSEKMPAAVARFGEMESSGWKGKAGTAIHESNTQGHFYTDVMTRFACRGMASTYELYLDDHLAAMQMCITGPGMLVLLKTSYDDSLSNHAPGRLLLYFLPEVSGF